MRDRGKYGAGLLVFVREDIPAKHLPSEGIPIEGIYIQLNFRRKNWLLRYTYSSNINIIENHLDVPKNNLDSYSPKNDNLMVIGDVSAKGSLECIKHFCETYDLNSLIEVPRSYKNSEKPTYIGLLLINQPKSFQSSSVVETDFH